MIFRRNEGLRYGLVELTSFFPGGEKQKMGWSRSVLPEAIATDYIEVPADHCGGWYEHPNRDNLVLFVYPGWVNGPSDRCWVGEAFEKADRTKFVNGWQTRVANLGAVIPLRKLGQ